MGSKPLSPIQNLLCFESTSEVLRSPIEVGQITDHGLCTVCFTFFCVFECFSFLLWIAEQWPSMLWQAGFLSVFLFVLSCGRLPRNPIVIAYAEVFTEVTDTANEGTLCTLARKIGARLWQCTQTVFFFFFKLCQCLNVSMISCLHCLVDCWVKCVMSCLADCWVTVGMMSCLADCWVTVGISHVLWAVENMSCLVGCVESMSYLCGLLSQSVWCHVLWAVESMSVWCHVLWTIESVLCFMLCLVDCWARVNVSMSCLVDCVESMSCLVDCWVSWYDAMRYDVMSCGPLSQSMSVLIDWFYWKPNRLKMPMYRESQRQMWAGQVKMGP